MRPTPTLPDPVGDAPWLVADIGGTNARFGWVAAPGQPVTEVRRLAVADHAGPAEAAAVYLDGLARHLGAGFAPPRAAALAVATPLGGDEVVFTNSPWRFSIERTREALGLQRLRLLNDFEALALSLPGLQPAQWQAAGGPARGLAGAPLAVIGPGTGLGVAGVLPTATGWQAMPGEGGHATLAAADDFEAAVLAAARGRHAHVSAERLLSGFGLPTLHAAVAAVTGAPAESLDAADIVGRGLSGECAVCHRTVDLFCALLGGFAGNVALTLGARGGVYIGGGIVPRLGERFTASAFRARFEAKGRFEGYLGAIPTRLITDTLAALGGAATALAPAGPS